MPEPVVSAALTTTSGPERANVLADHRRDADALAEREGVEEHQRERLVARASH